MAGRSSLSFKDFMPPFKGPKVRLLPDIIPTSHEPLIARLFSPSVAERDKRKSQDLFAEAKHLWDQYELTEERLEGFLASTSKNCAEAVRSVAELDELSDDICLAILRTLRAFMKAEPALFEEPEPPNHVSVEQDAYYRNHLRALIHNLNNYESQTGQWANFTTVLTIHALEHVPVNAHQDENDILLSAAPIHNFLPGNIYDEFVSLLSDDEVSQTGLFEPIRERVLHNIIQANGYNYEDYLQRKSQPRLKMPPEPSVFKGTPFETLFDSPISVYLPRKTRYEHHWIIGGTGHGKTQCNQNLILHDLLQVAKNNATIVVIDSQGDLINNISRLSLFAPGNVLHGKLTLIEPKDIEWPVALNLFDVNMERVNAYTPLMREQTINGIIELYDFVFGSLLEAEMTSKQSTLFRYITRLMISIPDANIQTLRQLVEKDGYDRYKKHIAKLTGTARAFFETECRSREFEQTKKQVLRRLWGILENQTFERMFSHPRNKLDIFSEMNEGRVILISTSKDLLKENGSKILGRFFIAMIVQAAIERASISEEDRMPTFIYIDECQDYLDHNIALILEQARKQKVGMILSHQYLGQLDPKLQQAFAANTSIKFAGGVSTKDARQLAPDMRTTHEFIENMPVGSFAAYAKGTTSNAVAYKTTFGALEQLDRMTEDEFAQIRSEMREKYAVPYDEVQQIISEQLPGMPNAGDAEGTGEGDEPDEIAPAVYTAPKAGPATPGSKTS